MLQKWLPYSFFIFTQGYVCCFYFILIFFFREQERKRAGRRDTLIGCLLYSPWSWINLQAGYIGPATFCYTGWHSNWLSHLAMAGATIFWRPLQCDGATGVPQQQWRYLVPSSRWCFTVNLSPSPMRLVSGFCPPLYAHADSKANSCLNL